MGELKKSSKSSSKKRSVDDVENNVKRKEKHLNLNSQNIVEKNNKKIKTKNRSDDESSQEDRKSDKERRISGGKKKNRDDKHLDDENNEEKKSDQLKDVIPENDLSRFPISREVVHNLNAININTLFPIQIQCLDPILKGSDVLGRARTGTGKTLAFSLPIVEILLKGDIGALTSNNSASRNYNNGGPPSSYNRLRPTGTQPRALIMVPTRELALQVSKVISSLSSKLKSLCVYGGTPYIDQIRPLERGVDIVVGTPGRLIDLIERGNLKLSKLKFVCLDEADQMLDIGFADDMDKVLIKIKTEKNLEEPIDEHMDYQVLLFSATIPSWIHKMVKNYMRKDRVFIDLIENQTQVSPVDIKHYAINVRWKKRPNVIYDVAMMYGDDTSKSSRTIIFAEKKGDCNVIAVEEKLASCGIQAIHGDISQKQRETTVQAFREGKFKYLVATNVCARGIDIPEVDLVINCEPPSDVDSYIHRSGRTGRAGRAGICVTLFSSFQESQIQNIRRSANIEFIYSGPPQQVDILRKSLVPGMKKIVVASKKVSDPLFLKHAQSLITEIGDPVLALSATLHVLFNAEANFRPRSILTDNEGFYTFIFKTDQLTHNVGYVRSIIQHNFLDLDVQKDITNMILAEDNRSVVVDINCDKVNVVKNIDGTTDLFITDVSCSGIRGVTIELAELLPKLPQKSSFRDRGVAPFGQRGNARHYNQKSNGYANKRSSYSHNNYNFSRENNSTQKNDSAKRDYRRFNN